MKELLHPGGVVRGRGREPPVCRAPDPGFNESLKRRPKPTFALRAPNGVRTKRLRPEQTCSSPPLLEETRGGETYKSNLRGSIGKSRFTQVAEGKENITHVSEKYLRCRRKCPDTVQLEKKSDWKTIYTLQSQLLKKYMFI